MKMKLLITGGSGFIGTHVVELFSRKMEILNIDVKPPKISGHKHYWKNVDINSYEKLEIEILRFRPHYVIHLAARTDLNGKCLEDYKSNVLGVENLVKILSSLKDLKRVIFTSSMLVCRPGYSPKNNLDFSPSTIYGESKVMTERIIRKSNPSYEWAIVRPTSIWGPWFGEPYRNFFDLVIRKIYFHIGSVSCTKTYGYVENLVYQIDSLLSAPSEKIQGDVFYLGDYKSTNIKDWANEIAEKLGITIKTIPYPIIKIAAFVGDIFKILGIRFPMTSFRLKNMTTNNVVDLSNMKKIAPNLPVTRIEGIEKTLVWLKSKK